MKFYKWVYDDAETIHRIPGFVWADLQDAIDMKDEYLDWTFSPTGKEVNLYGCVQEI